MIKCFLSHSSKDKERYVRLVARQIRRETKIFDEQTFEEGMSPIEEIINGLDEASLFVLFISDTALDSDWVRDELTKAKDYLDEGKLQRIFPILIDAHIDYSDNRIPEWLKESTNIQHISRPAKAARKINSRLIEISWKFHPRLKERESIFVGRNTLIDEIEERLDDFRKNTPSVLIASGLPSIGRKALLRHATRKANVVRESYEYPVITLSSQDSIEDFVLKIHDLGFSSEISVASRLRGSLTDKVSLALEIASQIVSEKERILIEDNGVIVQFNGEIVDWFTDLVASIKSQQHLTFCIASRLRPNKSINHKNNSFYCLYVDELHPQERNGLLVRYAKYRQLNISKEDLGFFSDLLTGFPEQVIYAVDVVDDLGIFDAKKRSHEIQEYSSNKAKLILDRYTLNADVLEFIYLLSKFEFISYELIFSIVDEPTHASILNELLSTAVCERLGSSGEYIRVNEVIRDYISRGRFGIPTKYKPAISSHVEEYIRQYKDDSEDLADYLFSVQEAVIAGKSVPDSILIPSIIIKTIKKLYDEDRNYKDALKLCNRVLQQEKTIHSNSVKHVRYIKCQCLARLADRDFFGEVQHIEEPDKSFLFGFYYRIVGEYERAKKSFFRVLREKSNDVRAIGELVRVFIQTEEYDQAFEMAKVNYQARPGNPINLNNYFTCLIHKEKTTENRDELEKVLKTLSLDTSERAQEMSLSAKARLYALYDNDLAEAFNEIEEAINTFPENHYPLLTKADLAVHSRNISKLSESLTSLEPKISRRSNSYRSFLRYKAFLIALNGRALEAKQFAKKELSGIGPRAMERLNHRIEELSKPLTIA